MSAMNPATMAARSPDEPQAGNEVGTPPRPLADLLEEMEPASADLARAAVDWLLPEDAELADLGQVELQEFLWYELPLKWLVETSELHEITWSLGDLFTAAGLERYAALCRATQTHLLLDAWQENDREPARRTMIRAITSSGVDPPDTALIRWGALFGEVEHSARRRVSRALQRAVEAGELVPGQRGWKQLAARITDASLTVPQLDLEGETTLAAVFGERGKSWASGAPLARRSLLTRMLPLLAGEAEVPAETDECLLPIRWLLEHIGDGVTLTQAGWLPKALVLEANDTFGWFDLLGLTVRTETDLPELATLNELARRTRLVTKKGRKVSLSATGRRALSDPGLLWRIVVADVFSARTYAGEGAALAAATLLRAGAPVPCPIVEAKVWAALVGRWRAASGRELDQWAGLEATRDFGLLAGVFGWIEQDDDWHNRTWMLTSAGRQAALMGLQVQARAPRDHP